MFIVKENMKNHFMGKVKMFLSVNVKLNYKIIKLFISLLRNGHNGDECLN